MTTYAPWREWPTTSLESRLLTFLEEREARIVSLGILDVRHGAAALIQAFVTAEPNVSPADVWDALLRLIGDHSIIRLEVDDHGKPSVVRSHAAEMVRLTRLVRQRFADHERSDESPPVVRDLVWNPTRRLRPKRDRDLRAQLQPPPDLPRRELETAQLAITQLTDAVTEYIGGATYLASGFQVRAFTALSSSMLGRGARKRGFVVSAGTGAGKTHAFLFPTLVAATAKGRQGVKGTNAICVYNRVRLAVNQFQDFVALLARLNTRLQTPLSIGIDFGEVPYRASDFRKGPTGKRPQPLRRWDYDDAAEAWICPWARCPFCDAALVVLRRVDATLRCSTHGEFPFIRSHRDAIAESPPTFYIATGASLQSRLQDSDYQGVFGSKNWSAPGLIMFDEIHLYEGVEGIQSAMLARRLRRRVESAGNSPTIVGLSATIAEASRFFSDFTGIPSSNIDEITPDAGELQWDGVEHFISLKAEPDEEVSPLSTVIQTSMVLGHLLPHPNAERHRVFCFSDSLDRVGRWVDRTSDAERNLALFEMRRPGVMRNNIVNPRSPQDVADPVTYPSLGPRNNCANCIAASQPDSTCSAFREGECWFPMHTVGTQIPLSVGTQTSRTSRGLETHDLVVATQSLEVGYDDSRVRGIVQYLAPSGAAAFTQRKGRAGRPSDSRTYVATVLSPYRRKDEFFFRNLHLLTDPTFERIPLNYRNRVLARAHALHLILDRIAQYGAFTAADVRREHLDLVMRAVEGRNWDAVVADIKQTFNLSDEELLAIVDDDVAGTLRVLLPELVAAVGGLDPASQYVKVHELLGGRIPSDLLSAMPTETIRMRPATGDPDDEEDVDVLFGLSEGAPGNVRYRYSSPMWVPLRNINDSGFEVGAPYGVDPTVSPVAMLDLVRLPPSMIAAFGLQGAQIPLRQPEYVALQAFSAPGRRDSRYRIQTDGRVEATPHTGQRVRDGSGSRLVRFTLVDLPQAQERWTPGTTPEAFAHSLGAAFASIETALSNADRPMIAKRFALGADFGLTTETGESHEGTLAFHSDGHPVALGHEVRSDGIRFVWQGLGGYQPTGDLRDEVAWSAFRERAIAAIPTGNVFARSKAVDAIMFCLSSEAIAGRSPDSWLEAFRVGDAAAVRRIQAAFTSLFDPKERTQDSFDAIVAAQAARDAVASSYQSTVAAKQNWSVELESFVRDSVLISLSTAMVRGIERVLTVDLSDSVDSRADLVADGCAATGPAAFDLFEIASGGIGVIDLVARTWRERAVSFWNAAEEVAYSCPIARRQALLQALGELDESAIALVGAAAQQLVQSTQPLEMKIGTFRASVSSAIGWSPDDIDLRSLLQLLGSSTDPAFEISLLHAVASAARALRGATQRWPTSRELGVHLLDALTAGAYGAQHPIATLGANLAAWINPVTESERYQRTLRSQLERRYVRSCDPACPSCIASDSVSSTPANRSLLTDYLDGLGAASSFDFADFGSDGATANLSRLWLLGNASVRMGYDDADAMDVSDLIARLTTEKVPGRFSDISASVTWARVRAVTSAGYEREIGIQIGPGEPG